MFQINTTKPREQIKPILKTPITPNLLKNLKPNEVYNNFYPCFNQGYVDKNNNIVGKGDYTTCYNFILKSLKNKSFTEANLAISKENTLNKFIGKHNNRINFKSVIAKYQGVLGISNSTTILEMNDRIRELCNLNYTTILVKFIKFKSL